MGVRKRVRRTVRNSRDKWVEIKTLSTNAFRHHRKGWTIAAVTSAFLVVTTLSGIAYYQSHLESLYAVSYQGKWIGYVKNPNEVKAWIAETGKKEAKQYDPSIKMVLSGDIHYQPVRIFQGKSNETTVFNVLAQQLEMKALATQVVINGQPIATVADTATAQEIINMYKKQFISKDVSLLNQPSYDNNSTKSQMSGLPSKNRVKIAALASETKATMAAPSKEVKLEAAYIKENVQFNNILIDPTQVMDPDSLVTLLEKGTLEQKTYKIKQGDTLSEVAVKFNMTTKELLANNPGLADDDYLQIGQELNVTKVKPMLSVITKERITKQVTIPYQTEVRYDDGALKGEKKVIQPGKGGKKQVSLEIVKENGVEQNRTVLEGNVIKKPVAEIVVEGTKVVSSRGSGDLLWPVRGGGVITSPFGKRWGSMHEGIDISGVTDRGIIAADKGTVELAGWSGGYGYAIIIAHDNGIKTVYAHLSKILVSEGKTVARGQLIGIMGSTGDSTGIHLHFESRVNGVQRNPLNYVSRN